MAITMGWLDSLYSRAVAGVAITRRRVVALGAGGSGVIATRAVPEGLVEPQPVTANVSSASQLGQIVAEALDEVSAVGSGVALLVPDLAVSTTLVAAGAGASRRELVAGLAAVLPYPMSEARTDFWRGRRGEVLGAGIRSTIVRQFEQVVEAADCRLGWVDGTSLARIPSWARSGDGPSGKEVQIQLYQAHYCLSVFDDGELTDLRVKLRAPAELAEIAREIERIPKRDGDTRPVAARMYGPGASELAAMSAVTTVDASDRDPLPEALQALVARGNP